MHAKWQNSAQKQRRTRNDRYRIIVQQVIWVDSTTVS